MTNRIFIIIISSIFTCTVYAAEWNMPWICHPNANSQAQLWFRKQIHFTETPQHSILSIACTGKYILYVNSRNTDTNVLEPYTTKTDTTNIINYDISRFLHKGYNTIAIWYSPENRYEKAPKEQLAAELYGDTDDGTSFYYETDSTWLCKESNAYTLENGGETIIGTNYKESWKENQCTFSDWQTATCTGQSPFNIVKRIPYFGLVEHISHIYPYKSFEKNHNKVVYDFGHSFSGWVRITLRGMKKGEKIEVNGLTYICTGEMDEQACRRFTKSESGMALIVGPEDFSIERIMKIEGIHIGTFLRINYLY